MIFNHQRVGLYVVLPLAFAGCMSDSSSTGGSAMPAPLQKAQRTSFVSYLSESSKILELSTVTLRAGDSSAPGSNPGRTKPFIEELTQPLMQLAGKMAPTASAAPQDLKAILNQELASGKCKFGVTGAPTANPSPGQPITMQTSLSGAGCSFESNSTVKVLSQSQNHIVTDMKVTLALKSAQLISSYDVSSVDLQVSGEIKTDPKKSVAVNLTMATKQQSKLHGVVTSSVNMSSMMPVDQNMQPTVALTCRFQSKDWNVVFAANTNSGSEPTATLNGEKLTEADQDVVMAITRSFSMFQPQYVAADSNMGGSRR